MTTSTVFPEGPLLVCIVPAQLGDETLHNTGSKPFGRTCVGSRRKTLAVIGEGEMQTLVLRFQSDFDLALLTRFESMFRRVEHQF
jgi:hypothetical protein